MSPAETITIHHYGMNSQSCDILRSTGLGHGSAEVVETCPPEERPTRYARIHEVRGARYRTYPGHRPSDAVAFILEGGERIPIHAAEMVYNDACLIDSLTRPGKYESFCTPIERQILEIARTKYEPPKVQ